MSKEKLKIAIIAPYPSPGEKHIHDSGVASYTKNLVENLKRVNPLLELHIISDYKNNKIKLYMDDHNIIVHRVYRREPRYIFKVIKAVYRIKPDIIHIQHEYFLYGGLLTTILFPLLIALLRLTFHTVIVTMHGVVPLKLLDDQEFKRENGIRGLTPVLKLGLLLVTKFIVLLSNKIIVHEPYLKEYLVKDYKEKPEKIIIIPHGVENNHNALPKEEAKKKLGLSERVVLMFFGYLTGYKGIEDLLDMYREIAKRIPNTALIIAGGVHPRLAREEFYREWIRSIIRKAAKIQYELHNKGRIIFTGYIPEKEIALYFSASDIIVLPYKVRIAASGPEALALAFEKCYVINSNKINNKNNYFIKHIINTLLNYEMCAKHSINLKTRRLWKNIAKLHLKTYKNAIKK
ncbi:MAG: glycosyltransferase [Desulfurococcales archaeon]|nr:glycosyltransferase [Desulfurococcales archaeon]